jgi:hypothetical protein
VGKSGVRVVRGLEGAVNMGEQAAVRPFLQPGRDVDVKIGNTKLFDSSGVKNFNDWFQRQHRYNVAALDKQEDLFNSFLGGQYANNIMVKGVRAVSGVEEFTAGHPEYMIGPAASERVLYGILGKGALTDALVAGGPRAKLAYKAIKGAADGYLIGKYGGGTDKEAKQSAAVFGVLEGAGPLLSNIAKDARTGSAIPAGLGEAKDAAVKFLSRLTVWGGAKRTEQALRAASSISEESIAKADPTKVTGAVTKASAKVLDTVAQGLGYKGFWEAQRAGKSKELAAGVTELLQQANNEAAVHNPELIAMQAKNDVAQVAKSPGGADLIAGLTKMGIDPVKHITESVASNARVAGGDLASLKAKVVEDVNHSVNSVVAAGLPTEEKFTGLGPGAASVKEKDVLGNLLSLVETRIPMQSKTQTLTFMWGIADNLPSEAKVPLAQAMKEIYGHNIKEWDAAARRLDEHLDKMIATGHVAPDDMRGVFHSTKLTGEPTKWQEQLDAEHEAAKNRGIEMERTERGTLKMGADTERLARILGSSLYKDRGSKVVVKELMQNAYDATRELPPGEGVVKVHFANNKDYEGHNVTVSDNGKGMTPDEIFTVFTNLGSSGKADMAEASGGFGLAKAAPFMIADKLEVETVARDPKTGKLIQTSFTSTPDDIISGNVTPKTAEAPAGTKTGTKIKATFDKENDYHAKNFVRNAQRSPRAPAKLEATRETYPGSAFSEPIEETLPEVNRHIATVSVPESADLNFYASTEKNPISKAIGAIEIEVQNNGIYQFTKNKWLDVGATLKGIPSRIVVDVKATVGEGHVGYPFEANREGLRGPTDEAIDEAVNQHFIEPALNAARDEIGKMYDSLPSIQFKDGTKAPVYDAGSRFTPEELQQIMSNPVIQSITKTMHSGMREMTDRLNQGTVNAWFGGGPNAKKLGAGVERIGIVFSDKVHGVYVPNIAREGKGSIFINPLSFAEGTTPDEVASLMHHTMKHELIHDLVKGHNETFTSAEAKVSQALGLRFELKNMEAIRAAYTGGSDAFKPQLSEALRLYKESRGRAETAADIFGGEELTSGMGEPDKK